MYPCCPQRPGEATTNPATGVIQLGALLWVLGTKSVSSKRVANANHWTICPVLGNFSRELNPGLMHAEKNYYFLISLFLFDVHCCFACMYLCADVRSSGTRVRQLWTVMGARSWTWILWKGRPLNHWAISPNLKMWFLPQSIFWVKLSLNSLCFVLFVR